MKTYHCAKCADRGEVAVRHVLRVLVERWPGEVSTLRIEARFNEARQRVELRMGYSIETRMVGYMLLIPLEVCVRGGTDHALGRMFHMADTKLRRALAGRPTSEQQIEYEEL